MTSFLTAAAKRKNKGGLFKVLNQQTRGMATEKQILMRITSTSNIAKITKSMKMVSAAKMRGAQNRLTQGSPFTKWLNNVGEQPHDVNDGGLPQERLGKNNMLITLSSDRGLCGGCNSYASKATRNTINAISEGEKSIFVVGEKARAQLRRGYAEYIAGNVTECWTTPPSFAMASAIAQSALAVKEFDTAHIVYNQFVSAIAYNTTIRSVSVGPSSASSTDVDPLISYEVEPDNREEVMRDLAEFQLASALFHGMIENATSEESSRMAAMENATSNAQELIQGLTLTYNKARQARITTELIEIISGAASLDG